MKMLNKKYVFAALVALASPLNASKIDDKKPVGKVVVLTVSSIVLMYLGGITFMDKESLEDGDGVLGEVDSFGPSPEQTLNMLKLCVEDMGRHLKDNREYFIDKIQAEHTVNYIYHNISDILNVMQDREMRGGNNMQSKPYININCKTSPIELINKKIKSNDDQGNTSDGSSVISIDNNNNNNSDYYTDDSNDGCNENVQVGGNGKPIIKDTSKKPKIEESSEEGDETDNGELTIANAPPVKDTYLKPIPKNLNFKKRAKSKPPAKGKIDPKHQYRSNKAIKPNNKKSRNGKGFGLLDPKELQEKKDPVRRKKQGIPLLKKLSKKDKGKDKT